MVYKTLKTYQCWALASLFAPLCHKSHGAVKRSKKNVAVLVSRIYAIVTPFQTKFCKKFKIQSKCHVIFDYEKYVKFKKKTPTFPFGNEDISAPLLKGNGSVCDCLILFGHFQVIGMKLI